MYEFTQRNVALFYRKQIGDLKTNKPTKPNKKTRMFYKETKRLRVTGSQRAASAEV